MKRQHILRLLFALVILVLIMPELQRRFSLVNIPPLEGAFELGQRPSFSAGQWADGSYQQKMEAYIEERVGFRPFLVRLRNQWDFLIYKKAHAEGVIIAKQGVIIEEDYILEYLGKLFIGKETIDKKLERVKFVQDTLSRKGIHLAIVFAPGKASYYSELIPARYHPERKTISNYDYFSSQCQALGINNLDLNRFFLTLKPHTQYPLYPKYGTHWSTYGMSLAADTLVKYVESLCQQPLNHLVIGAVETTNQLRDTDFDGGKSMNLLWKPILEPMAYPMLGFENDPNKHRPPVLVIADSYYWNIYNTGLPKNIFANEAFWFYNHHVYPEYYNNQQTVDQLNLQQEVEKQEVILVMITERFLYTAFWNFTDNLYRIYKPGYREDYLYNNGNSIRRVREWFEHVIGKSKIKGVTIEEMVNLDAEYMFMNDFEKLPDKTYEDYLLYYELSIRRDAQWLADVERKARENKISLEEMLHRDAVWLYERNILGMHQ